VVFPALEQGKPAVERGTCLSPVEHGQPEEKGAGWQRHPLSKANGTSVRCKAPVPAEAKCRFAAGSATGRAVPAAEKCFPFSGFCPSIRAAMSSILEALRDHPIRHFAAGETVLAQGGHTGLLFVLIEGAVEVVKDDVTVATASEAGAIFGDLAALLGVPHTAAVRAVRESRFYVVSNPRAFLEQSPPVCLHLCELLARRLDAMNKYLVDVKHQFAGHDHLGMVDGVLETLMNRQPRRRVTPRESTLRGPEIPD
jgi:CRP/FNR family cyclic AMP-dependent transcriptional regulator